MIIEAFKIAGIWLAIVVATFASVMMMFGVAWIVLGSIL